MADLTVLAFNYTASINKAMDRHNDQFAVIFNATQKGKIRDKHNTCSNIWFRIKNFY